MLGHIQSTQCYQVNYHCHSAPARGIDNIRVRYCLYSAYNLLPQLLEYMYLIDYLLNLSSQTLMGVIALMGLEMV